jgi:probable HAF family extracellular repeat protein
MSTARGVSDDGSAVTGWFTQADGKNFAFRWTPSTGMQNLGTLPQHYTSEAYGISGDGNRVVGVSFYVGNLLCCNDTQSDYRHPLLKAHHTHQTRTTTKKLRCKLYTTPFANTSRRAKRNPRLRTPSPNLRLITEITVSTFQR